MFGVVLPLLLKRNIGVGGVLDSSEVLVVMPPFLACMVLYRCDVMLCFEVQDLKY
jgi:hypothetical protein